MKILHITPAYVPAYRHGGPIRSVHELNKWLVKKGMDITVYTTNVDGPNILDVPVQKEVLMDGVKVIYFPASFPRRWYNSKEMNRAMDAHIKEFDVVHITSTFLAASFWGSWYARKHKVPYIISPRGNYMWDTYHKKYLKKRLYTEIVEKTALRQAAAIHFTAQIEREDYISQGLPLRMGIVIPNGIDDETFKENPKPGLFREKYGLKDKKIILFLSRISWKKGFDVLIPAFAEIAKEFPETVLVVAGNDEENYKGQVEDIIKENGVGDKVIFTGMILGEEKVAALKESDMFVLPSVSENFANAVVEALYFGLSVVVTEGVAVSKEIKEAEAGLVVKKDTEELAGAMKTVLEKPQLAKNMAEKGKVLVREKFFWPQIAEEWVKMYNKLKE